MEDLLSRSMEQKQVGRPKGSPNRITAQVKVLLANWVETELKNISILYEKLSDKEKARFIINILPYVTPRMKEMDLAISDIPESSIEEIIKRLLDGEY
jgi:hypothetical protein